MKALKKYCSNHVIGKLQKRGVVGVLPLAVSGDLVIIDIRQYRQPPM